MTTIVDSLVVRLGLDPSEFDAGQKRAAASWLKTQQAAKAGGKEIEDANKRTADSFDRVTKSALGLFAVLIGARSFKDFAVSITTTDAALGRMGTNLNMSAQQLARWQGAAVRAGGSAEAAAGAVQTANDQLLNERINGVPLPASIARLFSHTGINPNLSGSTEQYLDSIAQAAAYDTQHMGAQQTAYLLQQAGLGGLTNLMIQGNVPGQLAATPTPSADAIANAQDLLARWTKMQQSLSAGFGNAFEDFEPAFRPFLDDLTELGDWVTKNEPSIKGFAKDVADVANSLGQWRVVLEGLVALWAGGKLVGMIGAVRGLLGGGAAAAGGAEAAAGAGAAGVASGTPLGLLIAAGALGVDAFNNTVKPTNGGEDAYVHQHQLTRYPNSGGTSVADQEAYIRQHAIALGINPDYAVAVARQEGLGGAYAGDDSSSFGDFQLHYGGVSGRYPNAGLGDAFTKSTGLDARDPSTWKAQIDFALEQIKAGGWGPWSGARAAGITGFMGVGAQSAAFAGATTIGSITIVVPGGDAKKIAGSIAPAIQRARIAQPANTGPM